MALALWHAQRDWINTELGGLVKTIRSQFILEVKSGK